jgi:hypothetical protein
MKFRRIVKQPVNYEEMEIALPFFQEDDHSTDDSTCDELTVFDLDGTRVSISKRTSWHDPSVEYTIESIPHYLWEGSIVGSNFLVDEDPAIKQEFIDRTKEVYLCMEALLRSVAPEEFEGE